VCEARCKLYRHEATDDGGKLADLGVNVLKVNRNKDGTSRLLSRLETTGTITLNARINANTVVKIVGEKRKDLSVVIAEMRAGKPVLSRYSIRCKDEVVAASLDKAFGDCK
jgi:hypothetical protein